MQRISLLIGLILVGNGFSQIFETPEISNEEDLMASAATLFGPKTFGIHHANLGNLGPLGYGGIGGMRMGSIGPLHYGHIGGIHADSFLGAANPNAEEDESPGGTGIPTGDKQYQEIVGSPMEQNWEEVNDQQFVGIQPNEQEMWELGLQPQVAENSRAFMNDGLFGINKGDKEIFEKIPPKPPALPPKFPKPPPHKPPPPHIPPPHIPPPHIPPPHIPPPPPPTYDYYGGYGSHSHGSHSHGSHGGSHEYPSSSYRGYGGGHIHSHGHIHGSHHGGHHGGSHGYHGSHGHLHGSSSHFHGSHSGNYHGGFGNSFRSNDEFQTMIPYGYESNDQFQAPNFR